jgi:L-fucose isomerase-like protein
LDIRWFDAASGAWTLANCGALASSFYRTDADPDGLSQVHVVPHVFGRGGGGAYPAPVSRQPVTLARLCRRDGEYWMAILAGETQSLERWELSQTTPQFPQARVLTSAGQEFLELYGSNHIHMTSGDVVQALEIFCRLVGIPVRVWAYSKPEAPNPSKE